MIAVFTTKIKTAQSAERVEYIDCISGVRFPTSNECPDYNT